jgi:hypothetical protein
MLEQLIHTLAEELEFEEIPKKEEGNIYQVPLNPQMSVRMQQLETGVSFWARIGPCPTVKREDLFILLMKANFLGQGTGGSVIALDENENFLTLSSIFPYDMNYKMFKDALEDFANYLDYWKEELVRHKKMAEETIL